MNNSLIEYKESFIFKIKNFFKRIFRKKDSYMQVEKIYNIKEKIQKSSQKKFMNDIKVDENVVNNFIEKKNFLKQIDGDEEMLNMLSIDRLQKLAEYYDSVIEENNRIIKKLKLYS